MRRPSRSASKGRPPSAFDPSGGGAPTDANSVAKSGASSSTSRNVGVVADRHALGRGEAAHHGGFTEVGGARRIAHQGAHLIAALGESFGQSASNLAGRSSDEDFHPSNIARVRSARALRNRSRVAA